MSQIGMLSCLALGDFPCAEGRIKRAMREPTPLEYEAPKKRRPRWLWGIVIVLILAILYLLICVAGLFCEVFGGGPR